MDYALLLAAAVAAGIISFSSPCCLPLIPGYLSYMLGLPLSDLDEGRARSTVLRAALLFVAGFAAIFTLLGMTSGLLGSLLLEHLPLIVRAAGAGIIVLGLANLGLFRMPMSLLADRRPALVHVGRGPRWAFPFGMAFAAGWTPCIGPVLATILTTAAAGQTAIWGGLLLLAYSAGLGIPFVMLALGVARAQQSLEFLRRNMRLIEQIGGVLLILVGVAFVTGAWREVFVPLQREFARLGWPPF